MRGHVISSYYNFLLTGSKQVAAAIALNLAVFSHILNHTLTRLQTTFYEARNPAFSTKADTDHLIVSEHAGAGDITSGHTHLSGIYKLKTMFNTVIHTNNNYV